MNTPSLEPNIGLVTRLAFLMVHYRQPMDFNQKRLREAEKVLKRWFKVIEPCGDDPPDEIIEAISNDLNIPKAIAIMNKYRKRKEGRKLYASMKFFGLLPTETQVESCYAECHEHNESYR